MLVEALLLESGVDKLDDNVVPVTVRANFHLEWASLQGEKNIKYNAT
jgi:hypothetical protein